MPTDLETQRAEEATATAVTIRLREHNRETQKKIQIAAVAFAAISAIAVSPAIAGVVAGLPAALEPIARIIVPVMWTAVNASILDRNVSAAVLASVIDQTGNVIETYADPDTLRQLGVQIPSINQATFSLDYAQKLANREVTQPLANAILTTTDPNTPLGSAVQNARTLATRKSLDFDKALKESGVTPEQVVQANPALREDVAAMALNAGLDEYAYDIDWFDPTTGKFKAPDKLAAIRENLALAKGEGVDAKLAALDDRISVYSKVYPRTGPLKPSRTGPLNPSRDLPPGTRPGMNATDAPSLFSELLTGAILTAPAWVPLLLLPALAERRARRRT